MRDRAPHVLNWVTRLWEVRPADLADTRPASSIPADLSFFFDMISSDYLPYLAANAAAVSRGDKQVHYQAQGVDWRIPTAPYRAECLNALKQKFTELPMDAQLEIGRHLDSNALDLLKSPATEIRPLAGTTGRLGLPL